MFRVLLTLELIFLQPLVSANQLDTDLLHSLSEDILAKLNNIHEQNTRYDLLQRRYNKFDIVEISPFEESHWDGIISKIHNHISNVSQKRKDELQTIADIVNESIVQYEQPQNSTFEEKIVEIALPTGNKTMRISPYLRWYYQPFHHEPFDVFVPVVKINRNETHSDLDWTEKTFERLNAESITNERYFIGTTSGVVRFFPNQTWPKEYDIFDSRIEPWFLEAASSKHDIALVIDKSGSVERVVKMIRTFARAIIKTLPPNHRFNVFLANSNADSTSWYFKEMSKCLGTGPLEADSTVKSIFLDELNIPNRIDAGNRSDINVAIENVSETFFNTENDEGNKKMVILFTDGMMNVDWDKLKAQTEKMNLILFVLDFATPVSTGTDKHWQKMLCGMGGHYVFVKNIGGWFEVIDMLFDVIAARSVKKVATEQATNVFNWSQPAVFRWSQPSVTFYNRVEKRKTIVLSHPIFKKEATAKSSLQGVVGIDIQLDHFVSSHILDAGSLAYEIVSLPDGKVISHPRLKSSGIVPTLTQVNQDGTSNVLYPLPYLTDAPITKIGLVKSETISGLTYQLVIPANDALKLKRDFSGEQTLTIRTTGLEESEFLFIRPSAEGEPIDKADVVECAGEKTNLDNCDEDLKPLAEDIRITKGTFESWEAKESGQYGNFLITRNGLLWSTLNLTAYTKAIAKNIPEYLEFSADPDKFASQTLLVSKPFGKPIHLSKSVVKVLTDDTNLSDIDVKQLVQAVLGTRINDIDFSTAVEDSMKQSNLNLDATWTTFLLDHKGYVLYPDTNSSKFFGEVHSAVFEKLVDHAYYHGSRIFRDSICAEVVPASPARSISLFIVDVVSGLLSIISSIVLNTLLFVGNGLAFITPEISIVRNCHRNITAYERNFDRNESLQETYTCPGMLHSGREEECTGQYVAVPVRGSNLLLVLVKQDNVLCKCSTDPVFRVSEPFNDSQTFCDLHQNAPKADVGLNSDLVYDEEEYENLMEKTCSELGSNEVTSPNY
ncbi:hypothetical protein ACHWQZ_G004824 [Mnemiopsis leidyi]